MKLSIVICVYNTNKAYLEECLSSIKLSSLNAEEYEILVINDGSLVDYTEVFEKYSPRVIATENKGIFSARLLGIRLALGDYIAFVDSDDTVSFNYHEPMLEKAEQESADIVFNDWAFDTPRSKYYCKRDSIISSDFFVEGDDVLPFFIKNEGREHSYFVLWNKMFSASILKRAEEVLRPISDRWQKFNYSEDTLICYCAHSLAKVITNVHTGYYFYRVHDSQTVNAVSEEQLKAQIMNMSETFEIMECHAAYHPKFEEIIVCVEKWRKLMSRAHYSLAMARGYSSLFRLIKERYGVNELKKSTHKDGSAYSKNCLLPENFKEIDGFLRYIDGEVKSNRKVYINLSGAHPYIKKNVRYLMDISNVISVSSSGNKPPKAVIKLKNKILMNRLVYRFETRIFKKNSKIKAFLKKCLGE